MEISELGLPKKKKKTGTTDMTFRTPVYQIRPLIFCLYLFKEFAAS
jgi:hypothetical protein